MFFTKNKMSFTRDALVLQGDEPDIKTREKFQTICDTVNGVYWNSRGDWKVGDFTPQGRQNRYLATERWINEENGVWLMFLNATDKTHAPEGFMETERFLFYYKGFAAQLNFEEQPTNPVVFLFKTAVIAKNSNSISKAEFFALLESKGFNRKEYASALTQALRMIPRRCGYYQV